MKRGIID